MFSVPILGKESKTSAVGGVDGVSACLFWEGTSFSQPVLLAVHLVLELEATFPFQVMQTLREAG